LLGHDVNHKSAIHKVTSGNISQYTYIICWEITPTTFLLAGCEDVLEILPQWNEIDEPSYGNF
jgi:hypothetical protein